MNISISEYIQHRHNFEQLNINVLNKTDYENEKNDDLKILLKVSEKNPKKLDELGLYFSSKITWFYVIFGSLLSFFFSLGYTNNKEINISLYIFMVIFIPFLFNIFILFQYIYFIIKKKSININLDYSFEYFSLKTCLKASVVFYFKLLMFIYTICSAIFLIIYSTIMHFKFIIETTTLSATTITKIVNILSVPVKFIFPSIIPTYDKIVSTINLPTNDDIWLWFLIMLTFTWVIILRMIILLISKKQLNTIVKVSLLNNSKSKHIVKCIKEPETSTTNQNIEQMEETNKTNTISQIIKFDLSKSSNFNTVLLWQLSKGTNQKIKNNTLFNSAIVLESTLNLNKINLDKLGSILILINIDNAPKLSFINLLAKLDSHDITIKFVNVNGVIINSDNKIDEWLRFIRDKNIKIEEINE